MMLQAWAHISDTSSGGSSGGNGGSGDGGSKNGSAVVQLKGTVLPWVESMLRFYDEHYPKYENGTLWLKDAQACETWPNCTSSVPS